jgi:hypothetical protein
MHVKCIYPMLHTPDSMQDLESVLTLQQSRIFSPQLKGSSIGVTLTHLRFGLQSCEHATHVLVLGQRPVSGNDLHVYLYSRCAH